MTAGTVQVKATVNVLQRLLELCAFAVNLGELAHVCMKRHMLDVFAFEVVGII